MDMNKVEQAILEDLDSNVELRCGCPGGLCGYAVYGFVVG
jgi:hypothetical protein